MGTRTTEDVGIPDSSAVARSVPVGAAMNPSAKADRWLLNPENTFPMEARAADALPMDEGWQFEPKWDGFRCLAFREGNKVDLRAKSGKPLGRYFPEVVAMLASLEHDSFVIDGELMVSIDGKSDFEALQLRLHPAESRIRKLAVGTPAELTMFDMLANDGVTLLSEPLTVRRTSLARFAENLGNSGLLLTPYTRERAVAQQLLQKAGSSLDGVIAKRLDGPYDVGQRSMIKVKRLRTADCVVGGFRYEQASNLVGSLLLGLYNEGGQLDHVGFTSSFAALDRFELTRRLESLIQPPGFTGRSPGGVSRWNPERSGEFVPLRPDLVVEVRYDHVSGNRFRHGTRFMRWRPDKAPLQCRFNQLAPPIAADAFASSLT